MDSMDTIKVNTVMLEKVDALWAQLRAAYDPEDDTAVEIEICHELGMTNSETLEAFTYMARVADEFAHAIGEATGEGTEGIPCEACEFDDMGVRDLLIDDIEMCICLDCVQELYLMKTSEIYVVGG